jgi:hypothetical protein
MSLSVFSQQHFPHQIPAGNYSGICSIGNGCFAVVDDKAQHDGFYVFRLDIDTLQRRITKAENLGYRSSGRPNRDMEGICYRPSTETLFISGEADNEVYEYTLDGQRTGRRLEMPTDIKRASHNYGLEALTYDDCRHLFYAMTERPLPGEQVVRLMVFGDDLQLKHMYLYEPDAPISRKHVYGVSALCALSDGRLLVMERQIRVPKLKVGAKTLTRIYEVEFEDEKQTAKQDSTKQQGSTKQQDSTKQQAPTKGQDLLKKKLVTEFRTRLTITSRNFANFEGFCQVSPSLLLLIADSQNQYKGVLRDWFRLELLDD